MLSRNAILFIFILQSFFYGISQTQSSFYADSLAIESNFKELLRQNKIEANEKSILNALEKNLEDPESFQAQDLIQYYLASYYWEHKERVKTLSIINNNIKTPLVSEGYEAKFYSLRGDVFNSQKEYGKSIQSYLNAVKRYQAQGDSQREAIVYFNIAMIYLYLEDYSQSYKYSQKCYDEFKDDPDVENYLSYIGVLILCESNLNLLDSADIHLQHALSVLSDTEDMYGKALINYAKSDWEYKNQNYHKAQPYAIKSLMLSEEYGIDLLKVFSATLLMNIHNKLEEYSLAREYGLSAHEYAKDFTNLIIDYFVYDGLSSAYAGLGDFQEAYNYKYKTDSLKTLNWSIKTKRNMDSLMIQFQSLTDENKILGQKAIIANQNHLLQQRKNHLAISIFILVLLVFIIIIIFTFNQQKIKLINNQQEVEIARAINDSEEAERDRLASELHDGLAAELTALKLELEQNKTISDRAFYTLNKAHQMTRFISHNLSTYFINDIGLIEALANLINSYNINNNLQFYTNVDQPLKLPPKVETIIYRSTQELIQNAIKHSKATYIVVQAVINENTLSISVEDNGVGMKAEDLQFSIGLNSVKKRIQLINGIFDFDSSPNMGTTIFIKIRINK